MSTKNRRKGNLKKIILLLIIFAVAFAAGFGVFTFFKDRFPPEIVVTPDSGYVSFATEFSVSTQDSQSGIKSITIYIAQGNNTYPVFEKTFDAPPKSAQDTFKINSKKIKQGEFTLVVTATDSSFYNWGSGSTNKMELKYNLDTKAPRISTVSTIHNLNQGGSGLVLYTLSEEPKETGVRVGEYFFPAFKQPSGEYALSLCATQRN